MQRIIVRLAVVAAATALAAVPTAAVAKQGGDDSPGHGQGNGNGHGQANGNGNGHGQGSGDTGDSHGQPTPGGGDGPGDAPRPGSGQSPSAQPSPPPSGGDDGAAHGGGPPAGSPGAAHGRKVTLVFQGSVTAIDATSETATVKVKKGNHAARRFAGDSVDLDASAARVEVADVDGDGTAGLTDVSTGDRVLVHVRVPAASVTTTPLPASLLVDLTAPPPDHGADGS